MRNKLLEARVILPFCLWLTLSQLAVAETPGHGPFGFQRGMTKEQIIQLVGNGAVKEAKDDFLLLTTAPKPHPDFEEYALFISPRDGILKIVAAGKTIRTNGFGEEVHSAFMEIRDVISKSYGEPKTHEFLQSGSIWNEDRDWMMGLLKKERTLSAYWGLGTKMPNQITLIMLDSRALSTEKGYLKLVYEFQGWEQYVDSVKAKEGTVF